MRKEEVPGWKREAALRKLEAAGRKVLQILKVRKTSFGMFLVSGLEMRRLGKRFLHKDKKIVDVLAFPEPKAFPRPNQEGKFLGEICLNWDAYKNDSERLTFLTIHGILHLLGYRHDAENDMMRMEKLEKKLLSVIITK